MGFRAFIRPEAGIIRHDIDRVRRCGLFVATVATAKTATIGDTVLVEQDDVLTNWLIANHADVVLVRPDHLVFGSAKGPTALGKVFDALLTALGNPALVKTGKWLGAIRAGLRRVNPSIG